MYEWLLYWASVHTGNLAYCALGGRPRAVTLAERVNHHWERAWYRSPDGRAHVARYGR